MYPGSRSVFQFIPKVLDRVEVRALCQWKSYHTKLGKPFLKKNLTLCCWPLCTFTDVQPREAGFSLKQGFISPKNWTFPKWINSTTPAWWFSVYGENRAFFQSDDDTLPSHGLRVYCSKLTIFCGLLILTAQLLSLSHIYLLFVRQHRGHKIMIWAAVQPSSIGMAIWLAVGVYKPRSHPYFILVLWSDRNIKICKWQLDGLVWTKSKILLCAVELRFPWIGTKGPRPNHEKQPKYTKYFWPHSVQLQPAPTNFNVCGYFLLGAN